MQETSFRHVCFPGGHAIITVHGVQAAMHSRELATRLEVDGALSGGLPICGERFGRYRLDPPLVSSMIDDSVSNRTAMRPIPRRGGEI